MQTSSFETEIKVIVVGNGKIGKTSLTTRFVEGTFNGQYQKTIGVDYLEKRMYVPSIHEEVTFYLYDTAGQEEYNAMTRSFYRGAGAAMIAFSTVDRDSFLAVPSWISKVREECGRIPIILVQTKIDLLEQAQVSESESESLAIDCHLPLFRVCAKDDTNVGPAFEQICIDYVRRRRLLGGQIECPVRSIDDLVAPRQSPPSGVVPIAHPQRSQSTSLFSNCTLM